VGARAVLTAGLGSHDAMFTHKVRTSKKARLDRLDFRHPLLARRGSRLGRWAGDDVAERPEPWFAAEGGAGACSTPASTDRGLRRNPIVRASEPRHRNATVPIPGAVTAGGHRTVCSPQPVAAERRPPARGAATSPPEESRTVGDVDLALLLLARLRSRARRRCPTQRRSAEVCESYDPGVSTQARAVAARRLLMVAGPGT
jgi:hypothetical protein